MTKGYGLSLRMISQILIRGFRWRSYEMTQKQCMEAGFLSGDRGQYYCYNNTVKRCGNVIKFNNNCIGNASVNTKYAFLQ